MIISYAVVVVGEFATKWYLTYNYNHRKKRTMPLLDLLPRIEITDGDFIRTWKSLFGEEHFDKYYTNAFRYINYEAYLNDITPGSRPWPNGSVERDNYLFSQDDYYGELCLGTFYWPLSEDKGIDLSTCAPSHFYLMIRELSPGKRTKLEKLLLEILANDYKEFNEAYSQLDALAVSRLYLLNKDTVISSSCSFPPPRRQPKWKYK